MDLADAVQFPTGGRPLEPLNGSKCLWFARLQTDVVVYCTNTYQVTVFKHYDTSQLRAREPYYHIINYGVPFCIALSYWSLRSSVDGREHSDMPFPTAHRHDRGGSMRAEVPIGHAVIGYWLGECRPLPSALGIASDGSH